MKIYKDIQSESVCVCAPVHTYMLKKEETFNHLKLSKMTSDDRGFLYYFNLLLHIPYQGYLQSH